MKPKVVKLKNIHYPIEYESSYIYAHAELNDELKDLIAKSGYKEKGIDSRIIKGDRDNDKERIIS